MFTGDGFCAGVVLPDLLVALGCIDDDVWLPAGVALPDAVPADGVAGIPLGGLRGTCNKLFLGCCPGDSGDPRCCGVSDPP